MPFSDADGKAWCLEQYLRLSPETVVDIGVGAGTYSDLMRDHFPGHWTGIEVWEPYVSQFDLSSKYDRLIVEDVRTVDSREFEVDLVIAGDVLEHMTSEEARSLISKIRGRAKNLMVSVPLLHLDQGEWEGNHYETHMDHWSFPEMNEYLSSLPGKLESYEGDVLGCWLWQT